MSVFDELLQVRSSRKPFPVPEAILQIARTDPHVRACVFCWRNGECTWEQAITAAVVHLHERCEALEAQVKKNIDFLRTSPLFHLDEYAARQAAAEQDLKESVDQFAADESKVLEAAEAAKNNHSISIDTERVQAVYDALKSDNDLRREFGFKPLEADNDAARRVDGAFVTSASGQFSYAEMFRNAAEPDRPAIHYAPRALVSSCGILLPDLWRVASYTGIPANVTCEACKQQNPGLWPDEADSPAIVKGPE